MRLWCRNSPGWSVKATVLVQNSLRSQMSTSRSSPSGNSPPVRLVLFDVFDTLCTPRLPIHEQYFEEARLAGITTQALTAECVRQAFRPAFKEINSRHPLYGKHSVPHLDPAEWWTELIRSCMSNAGVSESEVDKAMPALGPALLRRFESDRGYANFSETLTTRSSLVLRTSTPILSILTVSSLRSMGVKTTVVSNADPRILHTLDALHITPLLSYPPTLSWDVEVSKPDPKIFRAACEACDETPGQGVLMVGDELNADFCGALAAGLEARLIRRPGEWSDGAVRQSEEDISGVHTISTLDEVASEVRQRNGLG